MGVGSSVSVLRAVGTTKVMPYCVLSPARVDAYSIHIWRLVAELLTELSTSLLVGWFVRLCKLEVTVIVTQFTLSVWVGCRPAMVWRT